MGFRYPECRTCPLANVSQTNYVPPEGSLRTAKYVLIGESPGRTEVNKGRPFVGASGRLLDKVLGLVGIDRRDCYITNAVKCHPRRNQTSPEMIEASRPVLLRELDGVKKGTRIAVMGGAAKDALFPHLPKGVLYNRGWHEWYGHDVLVTVHPAYAVYNPSNIKICILDMQRLKRGPQDPVEPDVILMVDESQIPSAIRWLKANLQPGQYVSLDVETEQVDPWKDRVLLVQLGVGANKVIEMSGPLAYTEGGRKFLEGFFRQNIQIVGHNLKFDLKFLHQQLGVNTGDEWNERYDDTMVMHYAIKETRPHGLKTLADEYYDTGPYDREVEQYLRSSEDNFGKVPKHVLARYGAIDAEVTRRLAYAFEDQLRREGLWERPYRWPLMYSFPTLLHMEEHGLMLDVPGLLHENETVIQPELRRIRARMVELSGREDLNPLSSMQVNEVLYDEMGMPIVRVRTRSKGTKKEKRSSAKEVVDKWKSMHEHGEGNLPDEGVEFATLAQDYRHVQKMEGSYIKGWIDYVQGDGRVHPTYRLDGTVTGRLSAYQPAVQTIPSDPTDKWGMIIARHVRAPDGWKFLYADYGQAELRLAACISEDPFMVEVYNSSDAPDYHSEVARRGFGEDFTMHERSLAKRLTFGWLFGGDTYEIAKDALMFDDATARHFAERWERLFKGMVQWRIDQGNLMLKQGYVQSPFGRRRRFPLITDSNKIDAIHAAINAPIQSSAADLTLLSCCELDRTYWEAGWAYVVLNIHDAVVMEVRDDHVEEMAQAMEDVMVGVAAKYFPQVPFEADVMVGQNLADLTIAAGDKKLDGEN